MKLGRRARGFLAGLGLLVATIALFDLVVGPALLVWRLERSVTVCCWRCRLEIGRVHLPLLSGTEGFGDLRFSSGSEGTLGIARVEAERPEVVVTQGDNDTPAWKS